MDLCSQTNTYPRLLSESGAISVLGELSVTVLHLVAGPQPLLTLLIIKPSVWSHHLPKILRKLDLEHFCVVGLKLVTLDAETALLLTPCSIQQVCSAD